MSELIDRQAAIDALDKRFDNIPMEQTAEILMLRKDLRELPTAQPEPHEGKWEQVSGQRYFTSASYFYRCSVCGENNPRNTNYCPNCGADMRGEKNE